MGDDTHYHDVLATSRQARVQRIRRDEERCRAVADAYSWLHEHLAALSPDNRAQAAVLDETRQMLSGAYGRARAAQRERHARATDILLAIEANAGPRDTPPTVQPDVDLAASRVTYGG